MWSSDFTNFKVAIQTNIASYPAKIFHVITEILGFQESSPVIWSSTLCSYALSRAYWHIDTCTFTLFSFIVLSSLGKQLNCEMNLLSYICLSKILTFFISEGDRM